MNNNYLPNRYQNSNLIPSMDGDDSNESPEILFITSFPPRECGIATYTQDLINAMREKFGSSFSLRVCALEAGENEYTYSSEVKYVLHTSEVAAYEKLALEINRNPAIAMIFIEHEFGLFGGDYGQYLILLLSLVTKPVITTFHTVLPKPDKQRKRVVQLIAEYSVCTIAMTKNSANILTEEYGVAAENVTVIAHGTHLIPFDNSLEDKNNNRFGDRLVLTTFGLLSSGKSIETALDALPAIIEEFPNVLYLIIGKTHPGVVKQEGENYRSSLQQKVVQLGLQNHVQFINKYLSLSDLLGYLLRTNIYLFTSKNPFQAVSGTFAYAMACGCPIISTPIPHAKEFLTGAGIIVDFQNAEQLATATINLLRNPKLLHEMRLNALHKIRPTAWQNSALAHLELLLQHTHMKAIAVHYKLPDISLAHVKRLTTEFGMIQFAALSTPDLGSGYTLDDNARALIAITKHFQITYDPADVPLVTIYINFIQQCQQSDGNLINYINAEGNYYDKNYSENLEDSNGRAIWALGEFISHGHLFSADLVAKAETIFRNSIPAISKMQSPRAIAFAIKGLHLFNQTNQEAPIDELITTLAKNLVSKYRFVSDKNWKWYEEYLTYANSVLPEALLCAYLSTGNPLFAEIARTSFDFLLSVIFKNDQIKVVSNQGWKMKGETSNQFGEQPIDVAYTILALGRFYDVFEEEEFLHKMEIAFNWFLGKNHLHQIIYNPCTGGCYDGLEEHHINLNQGAESTLSYLLSRLTMEIYHSRETDKIHRSKKIPV